MAAISQDQPDAQRAIRKGGFELLSVSVRVNGGENGTSQKNPQILQRLTKKDQTNVLLF